MHRQRANKTRASFHEVGYTGSWTAVAEWVLAFSSEMLSTASLEEAIAKVLVELFSFILHSLWALHVVITKGDAT